MPRKLKQSHDPDYRKELQDVSVLDVRRVFLEHQVDVEAHRCDVVDDVDGRLDELALVGRGYEPDEYF